MHRRCRQPQLQARTAVVAWTAPNCQLPRRIGHDTWSNKVAIRVVVPEDRLGGAYLVPGCIRHVENSTAAVGQLLRSVRDGWGVEDDRGIDVSGWRERSVIGQPVG